MGDKQNLLSSTSSHKSLLDKWTKKDTSSLGGGLSLTSGNLSGSPSLLGNTTGSPKHSLHSNVSAAPLKSSSLLSNITTKSGGGLSSPLELSTKSSILLSSTLSKPSSSSSLLSGPKLHSDHLGLSGKSSSLLAPTSSLLSSSLKPSESLLSSSLSTTPAFSTNLKVNQGIESSLGKLSLQTTINVKQSATGISGSVGKKRSKESSKVKKRKKVEGRDGTVSAQVIKRHTINAPDYYIKHDDETEYMEVDLPKFIPPDEDLRLAPTVARSLTDVVAIKRGLINCVSGSLISQPNFSNRSDMTRQQLTDNVRVVVEYDPEFILKVALYSRKELNIRTTSNFLLALSANLQPCRQFIKKYFSKSIALPSDWIEVAQIFQTLEGNNLRKGALPAALRKAMISKFPEFDQYQLAKYNKESSGKKKAAKARKLEAAAKKNKGKNSGRLFDSDSSDSEEEGENSTIEGLPPRRGGYVMRGRGRGRGIRPRDPDRAPREISEVSFDDRESAEQIKNERFTIKQLIRKLHITAPVEHVMCIIGKKYPFTMEDFYKSRLPGTFEEERAGKRMKLPVPETWETQVSLKGNKAETWQDLIDHKKLPFMAMLRNLRNLIKAGISAKHHNNVLRRLSDHKSVVNSKQFPFRFFSAYVVLQELEESYEKNQADIIALAESGGGAAAVAKAKADIMKKFKAAKSGGQGVRGGRGGARGRGRGVAPTTGGDDVKFPWWELKKAKKDAAGPKEVPYDKALIQRYRKALDTAVKIATVHNVQPIKGHTILLCDIGQSMDKPCSSAKGLGKPRTLKEISVLMGLMCKYSCEECEFLVFNEQSCRVVELKKGTILDNMDAVLQADMTGDFKTDMVQGIPYQVLLEKVRDRVQVDNLLVFGEDMYPHSRRGRIIGDWLKAYRHLVNPNLLHVAVTFSSPKAGFTNDIRPEHDNDIYISGYSDAILRFIAERGDAGMVHHVDKIDDAFQLRPMPKLRVQQQEVKELALQAPERCLRLTTPTPRWRTVRVFISSTFRDMHGERDLLTRFVFPELRALGRKHFINVYEVDLRWGVTEDQAKHNCTLSLCLQEVAKCDIFIGILGERYGWTPSSYDVPDTPEFDWVRQYPAGASVTELEMQLGALARPGQAKDKAFFFLRAGQFEADIPAPFAPDFKAESEVHKARMKKLKNRILTSGLEVFDEYPCEWGGCVDGKPVVAGLEEFGARMLNTLHNAVKKMCPDDDNLLTEADHLDQQHWALVEKCHSEFIGRQKLIKALIQKISSTWSGLVALVGKSGSGKTALLSSIIMEMVKSKTSPGAKNVFINMCGAASGSTNLATTLRRLASQVNARFGLGHTLPEDFKNLCIKFGDILTEAAQMGTAKLLVFLDGVDRMEDQHQPYSLEWLPSPLPENVVFIFTATAGSLLSKSLHRVSASEVSVGDLDMWDKSELVRQTLARHRKVLDESGFGNQMKLLMLKKEAHNPLYLKLACEELRVFGVFERVTDKLKSMPHTTAQMLQDILERLEGDHGYSLVSTALCLLACVRDGLYPEELYDLLNLFAHSCNSAIDHDLQPRDLHHFKLNPDDRLTPVTLTFLARSIMSFLNPSSSWSQVLSLGNAEISTAVYLRYMNSAGADIKFHRLLAGYFMIQADPEKNGTWKTQNIRAVSELPYHLASGGSFTDLTQVLCCHRFIQTKCSLGMAARLLDDFSPKSNNNKSMERERNRFINLQSVSEYRSFIFRNIEVLVNFPSLEWQQAINEPSSTLPYQDASKMASMCDDVPAYMEWKSKPEEESQCYLTMSNFKEPATSVCVSPDSAMFACGTQDQVVKLYSMESGKELKFFNGHSDTVTDVCFAGNGVLCSASVDTTLCLWDVANGHRLHTLKGHSRRVNSCSSNVKGQLVASGGWDCTVCVWKVSGGEKIAFFTLDCPVNCVDFHPEEELVVVGSWDSVIRIYNYFHKTRVAVLRGHSTSVRDIAYSPDGRHLASASMDGDVKIWAADKGSQVGNVKGHSGPVNKLIFSPTGREIITAGQDHQVKVWSGDLGIPVHRLDARDNGAATSVCISPTGLMLAVGYHLGQVRIYDVNTGVKLVEGKVTNCAIRALTYDPSGSYILAGCDDNITQVLESTQGSRICTLAGHTGPILCVTTSKRYVASCGEDFTACVYDEVRKCKAVRQSKPMRILKGHVAPVTSCSFSSDEKMMVTASRDASVRVYSMSSVCISDEPVPIHVMNDCHADWINACQWSNSGNYLVTGSNDFNLKVWDMSKKEEKTKLSGHASSINAVAYKFGCIISGSTDGTVKVWSHKGVEITTLRGHTLRVNACDMYIKYSNKGVKGQEEEEEEEKSWADMMETDGDKEEKDGKKPVRPRDVNVQEVIVVSAGDDGAVWIWKPLQAYSLSCLTGHSDRVLAVASDRSGQVTSCSLDRSVRVWKPRLQDTLDLGKHDAPVTFLASSDDGEILISGSRDGVLKLWKRNPETNRNEMKMSYQAHEKAINCGSFETESTNTFLTGGDDSMIYKWQIHDRKDGFFVRQVGQHKTNFPVSSLLPSRTLKSTMFYYSTWEGDIVVCQGFGLMSKVIYSLVDGLYDERKGVYATPTGCLDAKNWALNLTSNPDNPAQIIASTTQGECVVFKDYKLQGKVTVNSDNVDAGLERDKIPPNWVNCCCISRSNVMFAGDSRGQITAVPLKFHDLREKTEVKIHNSSITVVLALESTVLTAALDGCVKVWQLDLVDMESKDVGEWGYTQVGQFQCPSPVTSLRLVSESNEGLFLAAGDQLGNVHQLFWHK